MEIQHLIVFELRNQIVGQTLHSGLESNMPKKKSTAFNPTQIKNGKIVRLRKDGSIKAIIDDYNPKHKKTNENSN